MGERYCNCQAPFIEGRLLHGNRVGWHVSRVKSRQAEHSLDVEGKSYSPRRHLGPRLEFGKPAALDFMITSPLNHSTLNEASVMAGSAAPAAKLRNMPPMMRNATTWAEFVSLNGGDVWLLGRISQQVPRQTRYTDRYYNCLSEVISSVWVIRMAKHCPGQGQCYRALLARSSLF